MSEDVSMEEVDPVQMEINKIELCNLKVDIVKMTSRIDALLQHGKQKKNQVIRGISYGKNPVKRVVGQISSVAQPVVKLPSRERIEKGGSSVVKVKPSFM